ncbi:MAG: hypothetical protein GQ552_04410 [Flavobacteriaceae bacterium]|nr:hypothetical protein [Flavobacteriaceae bacterium]
MKQTLLFIFLFAMIQSYGQYNEGAPWMNNNILKKSSSNKITLQEQSNAFNQFWLGKDFNAKGSGHKPFKRW